MTKIKIMFFRNIYAKCVYSSRELDLHCETFPINEQFAISFKGLNTRLAQNGELGQHDLDIRHLSDKNWYCSLPYSQRREVIGFFGGVSRLLHLIGYKVLRLDPWNFSSGSYQTV